MAKIDFINQLKELGFKPVEIEDKKIYFEYCVPIGKNIGYTVLMGFEVGDDFPMNCPHGPHFKANGTNEWVEPMNGIHSSPFGNEWRHWSRPFNEWNRTRKTVAEYLSHIKNVLAGF
jgi:hypothetical protein